MALLQIAEPGQSSAPHQHKLAAGIDLGTTNSLVASVRSGTASTLVDSQGRSILPSVVNYGADATRVGYPAREQAETDPHNTVISVNVCLDVHCKTSTSVILICLTALKRVRKACRLCKPRKGIKTLFKSLPIF